MVCTCEDGVSGGSGSRIALFGLLSQPLGNCVMRGRLLNLSVPQFPPLKMGIFIVAVSVDYGKDAVMLSSRVGGNGRGILLHNVFLFSKLEINKLLPNTLKKQ